MLNVSMDSAHSADMTYSGGSSSTPGYGVIVYNAARDGNLKRLKVFLDKRPKEDVEELVNKRTFNTPPVVIASRNGHAEVVERGASVRSTGEVKFDGETIDEAPCIWAAAAAGHLECVKVLIHLGADVNQTTTTNSSAVRGACFDGHLQIVRYLVEHGADIEIANRHGHTPLMIAAYRNKLEVVRYLLSRAAEVNRRSSRGNTCLHDAAEAGSVRIVKELLAAGAKIQRDGHGMTPMLSAALIGHCNVVEYFADRPKLTIYEEESQTDDTYKSSPSSPSTQSVSGGVEDDVDAPKAGHPALAAGQMPAGAEGDASASDGSRRRRCTTSVSHHRRTCDAHERADSLKLLGATCVDKRRDIVAALNYWRRAVKMSAVGAGLGECGAQDMCSEMPTPIAAPVYGGYREVSTVADVEALAGDPDAIRMQALIIRERILGVKHPETFYYLRYRGAIYADVGRYERCYELWMYALKLQQHALMPMNVMTLITISAFAEIFGFMINDYLQNLADGSIAHSSADMGVTVPSFEHMASVLQCVITEIQRHQKGDVPSIEDDIHQQTCEDCAPRDPQTGLLRLVVSATQLVALIGRLDIRITEEQTKEMRRLLRQLVLLRPSLPHGETILHVACSETVTSSHPPTAGAPRNTEPVQMPSLYVVRALVAIGADVKSRDNLGRTPLHIVCSNQHRRECVVNCLLAAGAHVDARAIDGSTPMRMMDKRDPGSALRSLNLHAGNHADSPTPPPAIFNALAHRNLQCLAASAVSEYKLLDRYANQHQHNVVPKDVEQLVRSH